MASETVQETQQVETATDATAPAVEQSQEGARRERRQHTPPEELYDLSKPIPHEEKPDKAKHDAEVEAISSAIDALKIQKSGVQEKIETALDSGRNSAVGKEREALRALITNKKKLIDEKNVFRKSMDQAKKQADGLMNERKNAKAAVRYSDLPSIEAEIKKLKSRQETTSMSLSDEKRLIKEIEQLQSSKSLVADIKNKDSSIDSVIADKKMILTDIKKKDVEIDAVQKDIDEKKKVVDAMKETESESRKNINGLKEERESLKKQIGEKLDERNGVRTVFREQNNKWYDYQRAVKAQKKMKYEEEKQKREEERVAREKAYEEEEAKKIPYEEEMYMCKTLAEQLSKSYLGGEASEKKDAEAKKSDIIAVKDDPFAGFTPLKKNDDEIFLQHGKGKKKPRVRVSKKKAPPMFKLSVDYYEQFGLLNLTPPTGVETVQAAVDALNAKKEWYSQQARGSVPTVADARKVNQKAAAKLRQESEDKAPAPKKNGKLDISSDDFAPLSGAAGTSTMNANWGQKQESEEVAVTEIAETVEASA